MNRYSLNSPEWIKFNDKLDELVVLMDQWMIMDKKTDKKLKEFLALKGKTSLPKKTNPCLNEQNNRKPNS
jgi:hypothetical protein